MDEQELLKIQIKSYEFYAGLIERAVGGGSSAKLPRWDEQRAREYRDLAEQLRRQLEQLQTQQSGSQDAANSADAASATSGARTNTPTPAHS